MQEAHSHGRAVHVAEHEAGVQMAAGPSIRTPAEAPSNKREVAQHVPTRGRKDATARDEMSTTLLLFIILLLTTAHCCKKCRDVLIE